MERNRTAASTTEQYHYTRGRAIAGGRSLLIRHIIWGAISLAGSTVLIRWLGPEAWASYSIVYFLAVVFDYAFGASFLGRLVRLRSTPTQRQVETAVGVMQLVGLGVAACCCALAYPVADLYGRADLATCVFGLAGCVFVYCQRATSVALVERELRYRDIAVAEVIDQITFYGLAIALLSAGLGLTGVAIALAGRGALAALFLLRRRPVPAIGRIDSAELRELLSFGVPTLGASGLILVTGLVPAIALGGAHATSLAFVMTAATILGYAATAQTIMQRVGFPSLASLAGDGREFERAAQRITRLVNTLLVSLIAPLAVASPVAVPVLFGSAWDEAGQVFVAMAAGVCLNGISSIGTAALQALGHPKRSLALQAAMTVIYAGAALWLSRLMVPGLGVAVAFGVSRLVGVLVSGALLRASGVAVPSGREAAAVVAGAAVSSLLGAWVIVGSAVGPFIALAALGPAWFLARRTDWRVLLEAIRGRRVEALT